MRQGSSPLHHYTQALFSKMGVFSEKECIARTAVNHEHYAGTVEMEALCMVDMIKQNIIPSCKEAGMATAELEKAAATVAAGVAKIHAAADEEAKATVARELRLETMEEVRAIGMSGGKGGGGGGGDAAPPPPPEPPAQEAEAAPSPQKAVKKRVKKAAD